MTMQQPRLEDEVAEIVATLREHGPMSVPALQYAVGARHWGAGRFRAALRRALADGHCLRSTDHERERLVAATAADTHAAPLPHAG